MAQFISHGEWSDPELIYNGKSFNYWDIDDALWDMFYEEIAEDGMDPFSCEDAFNEYVQDNAVNYLEDCVFGGYDYKIVE